MSQIGVEFNRDRCSIKRSLEACEVLVLGSGNQAYGCRLWKWWYCWLQCPVPQWPSGLHIRVFVVSCLRQELWSQPASTFHQLNYSPPCALLFPPRKQRCNRVCFPALLGELSDTMHWPSPGDAERNKATSVPKEDTAWQERLTQNPPGLVSYAESGPEMLQSRGPPTVTYIPSIGLYLFLK